MDIQTLKLGHTYKMIIPYRAGKSTLYAVWKIRFKQDGKKYHARHIFLTRGYNTLRRAIYASLFGSKSEDILLGKKHRISYTTKNILDLQVLTADTIDILLK